MSFTTVADNTIRGAAGYSVLMAELLLAEGMIHDIGHSQTSYLGSIGERQ